MVMPHEEICAKMYSVVCNIKHVKLCACVCKRVRSGTYLCMRVHLCVRAEKSGEWNMAKRKFITCVLAPTKRTSHVNVGIFELLNAGCEWKPSSKP